MTDSLCIKLIPLIKGKSSMIDRLARPLCLFASPRLASPCLPSISMALGGGPTWHENWLPYRIRDPASYAP